MKKTVFITGGAGGLGGVTAHFLADRGWHVFAADLKGEALDAIGRRARIEAIPIDVMDPATIAAAVETVSAEVDGLDGVVNFAGVLVVGSVIEMPPEDFARVMDINLMGTYRVNHAFFPLLRARRGRIVNISSETGWETVPPFNGPYSTSKHAIEAYSDALRRELNFLGMKVIKVQPGPFKTEMLASIDGIFTRAADESKYFSRILHNLRRHAKSEQKRAHDPRLVAEAVFDALTSDDPEIAYSVKPDKGRAIISKLPEEWVDKLLEVVLR